MGSSANSRAIRDRGRACYSKEIYLPNNHRPRKLFGRRRLRQRPDEAHRRKPALRWGGRIAPDSMLEIVSTRQIPKGRHRDTTLGAKWHPTRASRTVAAERRCAFEGPYPRGTVPSPPPGVSPGEKMFEVTISKCVSLHIFTSCRIFQIRDVAPNLLQTGDSLA